MNNGSCGQCQHWLKKQQACPKDIHLKTRKSWDGCSTHFTKRAKQ